jgi:hypothetical protein
MRTVDEVQIALVDKLKTDTVLVALLGVSDKVKETQWQGSDFTYPAVRVENDVMPSPDGCSPDGVEITIFCLSEQKSSKQCSLIAAEVARLLHNTNFTGVNGVKFIGVKVKRIPYPRQQEGQSIWQSPVQITALVN